MLALDRDAVICDFAETYHVLDVWALPVPLMAALASGLREDSRIKMKMAGLRPLPMQAVLAKTSDEATLLRYMFAGLIGAKNQDDPVLLAELMAPSRERKKAQGFDSGADFLAAWNKIMKGGGVNG